MLVSNYTFNIAKDHVLAWESFWLTTLQPAWENGPEIKKIHPFFLLTEVENDGKTYAIQTFFDTQEGLLAFSDYFDEQLLPVIHRKFAGQYVFFQTVLASWTS